MNKQPCPEFPFFGARYPDATCIDGYLWDLDKCEGGELYGEGEIPCPFCNTEAFIEYDYFDVGPGETAAWIRLVKDKYGVQAQQKGGRHA